MSGMVALSIDRLELQRPSRTRLLKIAANARKEANACNSNSSPVTPSIDRRELLAGAIAGGASLASSVDSHALADPIGLPSFKHCHRATISDDINRRCCPPQPKRATIDFKPDSGPMRVRPAAHLVDKDYIAKYNEAYAKMRALSRGDPRSLRHQAKVHCAYCNYGYRQEGAPKQTLQIHFNWLFLPWHRWYLYFGDPGFALPFWSWDQEGGRYIPDMFRRETALYDAKRNTSHYEPTRVDLIYSLGSDKKSDEQIREDKLSVMYNNVAKVKQPDAFFGYPLRKGSSSINGPGGVERAPHNAVHIFCGSPDEHNNEDMGNFYSAGRDPLFYCHHGNVDRMWDVWRSLGNKDFTDPDYLNTKFLFFDENQDLVRVKVKDSLNNEKMLKYKYQAMPDDKSWTAYEPKPLKQTPWSGSSYEYRLVKASAENPEALKVEAEPVTITVDQPKGSACDEILVLEDMEIDMRSAISFNAFINLPEANKNTRVSCAEYVGTYSNVPHFMSDIGKGHTEIVNATFSIKANVEILGLKSADKLVVTLVPRGDGSLTFRGASIQYA
ncbi:(+)-larreatricin hydroxylase, chloroplastic [Selaginella moellendorffii]|nr:(+)-larreatricin hydroxylase, chloroplastic [Selaginella moellendorffii]|eukprot:XP_002990878.2 (+)-larreatricin hydroxylase, chloroplastic [Selaginella moellendorffii]